MKKHSLILGFFVGGLIISCNTKKSSDTDAASTASAEAAPMIIPESADTLLANGRKNIFLVGKRDLAGIFVERVIMPAGYKSNPHTHPGNMNITVINGSINIAFSSSHDSLLNVTTYGPGSFIIIPAGAPHFEWYTEITTMDVTGIGPLKTVNIPIIHSSR